MTKVEMVRKLCAATGMTKAQGQQALEATLEIVAEELENGEFVRLAGFGLFSTKVRPARTGRNPRTGDPMEIPEKRVIKFKPAKALATRVLV